MRALHHSFRSICLPARTGALTVAGCLLAGTAPLAARASSAGPILSVEEPEGFADLTDNQDMVVDVYFGGVRRGEATVTASPGAVTLRDPTRVVALLPAVTDAAMIRRALSPQILPANEGLSCGRMSDPDSCGRLVTDVAGVIFDRQHFRLDVFVNPAFLATGKRPEDRYVPVPSKSVSLINAIGAIVSGQTGRRGDTHFTMQDNLLVGSADRRLRADFSYDSVRGLGADTIALEWDRPELRFSAGELWAPGGDLEGPRKIVGLGVQSQIDTRLDRENLLGTPLIVFLDRRARVDLLREGRLVHSAIYEPGNQQIDTSGLPDGSYSIVLRVQEANGAPREERRFFSKNRKVPSLGRTDFFAFGGLQVDSASAALPAGRGRPYASAGVARRLGQHLAIEGMIEGREEAATVQLGASLLMQSAQIRAAAVAEIDGTVGALVQIASSGASRLSFNLDLRHVEGRSRSATTAPTIDIASGYSVWNAERYSQASGVVSYGRADVRFLATGFYRDNDDGTTRYSIGPAVEWDILRRGPLQLAIRADAAVTERGHSGFAGVSVSFVGRRSSVDARAGLRHSTIAGERLGGGAVFGVSGGWNPALHGAELAISGGYEHQPRQDDLTVSGDLRHQLGAVTADLSRATSEAGTTDQFSLGFHSTIVAGAGIADLAGRTTSESVVVAKVDGASASDRFEILVDDQVAGTIAGSAALPLALPAYRAYRIRIRPVSAALLSYDSATKVVGLYPGTVAKLVWTAAPIVVHFGRLVDARGTPLGNATLSGRSIWTETDDAGYFQLEAPAGSDLIVNTRDGRSFALVLPRGTSESSLVRLGTVACCGASDERPRSLAASYILTQETHR